jgi:hypothetical protein
LRIQKETNEANPLLPNAALALLHDGVPCSMEMAVDGVQTCGVERVTSVLGCTALLEPGVANFGT